MALSLTALGVLVCSLVYNVQGTTIMTSEPIATPTINMSMNDYMDTSSMHHSMDMSVDFSLSEIQPSIHWINGSCRIMPSTCICDDYDDEWMTVNVSVMSYMINMTATSEVIAMTMTPDHTGSSYLAPMPTTVAPMNASVSSINDTLHPNMTSNYTTPMVSCTCYGQYTWCRKNYTEVIPTMTGAVPPGNTAGNNGNNNGNNNNNNKNGNNVGSINPSLMPSYIVTGSLHKGDVDATVPLDTATMMMNMSAPTVSLAVTASVVVEEASASVMVKASTTPGGEVVPEPTTLPPVCTTDCAGVECGKAIANSCGHCVGGTTGVDVNHGKDCNNVCGGVARNDSCGVCTNPPAHDSTSLASPFVDCNGKCFEGAEVDSCGNCSGGSTGKATDFWMDSCGICGGDNSTCSGCDGVPNSRKIKDSCGVCGGDGSTCTNITSVYPSLLPTTSTSGRTVTVIGAGLNGEAIKCILEGEESQGTVVNITMCKCNIPDNITVGMKTFTVKVVKSGVDTSTADLQINIYDEASVKITAVTPEEFLTDTPAQLTFEGAGFVENPAAVCIVRSDNVLKLSAVFESGNYSCRLLAYEMAKNMTVGLAMNGVHELNSDVDLGRNVFAQAPSVTSSQFTDTGAVIVITFDYAIATASLTTCADIFTSGVASLGTAPTCTWADGRHLEITPDDDAIIEPASWLTLKPDVIKRDQMYSKVLGGELTIAAPANPVKPVPVIFGSTQISACGHLTLDGSQSSGGGGRNLKYDWSLTEVNAEITAVLDAAKNKTSVFINGTLMTAGSSYTFKLVVSNFISAEAVETTISVTKTTTNSPEVTIEGPLQGKALAGNSFYVTAMAKAASCSSDKALSYSWSVACSNSDAKTRAESSPGFQLTASKSAVKIDAGSLVGGQTYNITVVVSLTATPSIKTTMMTSVKVEWSPLEPAIAGGDRTLGRDSGTIELDAKSSTVDPDNAPGDLSCAWVCTDTSNDQPCYSASNKQTKISFPNDCLISLASTEFEAGKVYKITSAVSKGSRTGSSAVLLTVIEGNPPAVSAVTPTMKVNAGDKVSLEAKYTSSVEPTVEWICVQEDDYRYIDISDQTLISSKSDSYSQAGTSFTTRILKANVLNSGATYKFTVNVNDGSKIGSSNIIVEVRSGPTSGSFEAEPATLEQLQQVTVRAPRWVTEADAYPLEYQFGYLDNTGVFQTWKTQTSNEYSIAVPPGYGPNKILTLRMIVKDAFGSMKWMDKNITVNEPASIDEDVVGRLVEDTLQEAKDSGDFSEAVPTLMNVLNVVKNSSSSDDLKTKVMNTTAETLIAAVDATLLDKEKAKPILETFLDLNVEAMQSPKEILNSFEKVAVAHDGDLALEKVDESLKFLEDLAVKCDLTDTEVVEDLVSADDEIASSLANNVDLGDPAVEKSSTRCDIVAQHSLLVGDIQTSGTQASQVEFGNDLRSKYGFWECKSGKYCVGVKLTFVNYKQDYYTSISSVKPGILSSKVLSVTLRNPETGASLLVSSLSDPITVSFNTGTPSAGKTFKGYYYSESQKKWSSAGLTSTLDGSTLKVTSNHLTTFAPAEEDENVVSTSGGQVNTSTTVAPSSDNVFKVSFDLSNATWNDNYTNSSHPDYQALKNSILAELSKVYQGDPTLKDIVLDEFLPSGDNVKVVVKMTFDDSNTDPGAKLKDSLSDGKLGDIGIDKDSLKWVDSFAPSESSEDENTELIIGTVFGVFFGLAIILLGAAWLKNRQSRSKVGSSHPSVQEDAQPPEGPEIVQETPA